MTNPSRAASNGRLAVAGSALRVDIERMTSNASKMRGASGTSTPPASAARHKPLLTARNASPIATAPAAHEFEFEIVGPCKPKWIATLQHAAAGNTLSARIGLIAFGPFS